MTFRYARHTNDLEALKGFYTSFLGLQVLGDFRGHEGYDGVFLGWEGADWHLEFTSSTEKPMHQFDADDLLVFYFNSSMEIMAVVERLRRNNIPEVEAKNPYWKSNGHTFTDPDGQRIVVSLKQIPIAFNSNITEILKVAKIDTWDYFLNHVRNLPYGRNAVRSDFDLVITEGKGTCSSKHALVKQVADFNGIKGVKLMLCLYRMNRINTPAIGNTLEGAGLGYIPEAHCYLNLNGLRIDLTNPGSGMRRLEHDILEETEILPEQVVRYKVEYHQKFLRDWLERENIKITFDMLWAIREMCITEMSN
jgi:catechol 2,3-dioxygenase-like lactoylglutathione lyase family enzyme